MNCRKWRARFFEYRDGTLSPHKKEDLNAHLAICPSCRAEMEGEKNWARGLHESYGTATACLLFDPDKTRIAGGASSAPLSLRWTGVFRSEGKIRAFRRLAVSAGAAIILAAFMLGPFKPAKRGAFPTAAMEAQLSSLRSDDLPDPFQDWIEKRMIFTIEDKAAGKAENYITDRMGTVRKISAPGRD